MTIVHVALDGIMEGALGIGVDVVDSATRLSLLDRVGGPPARAALHQKVVSHDGRPVRSTRGRPLAVDAAWSLRALRSGDVIVVPGVLATDERSVGRLLARADVRSLVTFLRRASDKGVLVGASCSATFFLAEAGLLNGRSATTTWWLTPSFARRFPDVNLSAARMVVDGPTTMTAGSAFAHADLVLAVVARVAGPALARRTANYLVLDSRASQARYMVLEHLRTFDPALESVEEHVVANLHRQIPLAELARVAGASPRTLARRVARAIGTTPLEFVRRIRVAHATHALDTTSDSVEAVASRVGYADAAALRRAFRKQVGEAPRGRRPRR